MTEYIKSISILLVPRQPGSQCAGPTYLPGQEIVHRGSLSSHSKAWDACVLQYGLWTLPLRYRTSLCFVCS